MEALHRTKLHVSALIVAYNAFMNLVDRFDQLRSSNQTMRREQRISMALFTFALDKAVQNAYAVSRRAVQCTLSLTELKRKVSNSLSGPRFCAIHDQPRS